MQGMAREGGGAQDGAGTNVGAVYLRKGCAASAEEKDGGVKMVAWWWILIALFIGANIGIFAAGLLAAAKKGEKNDFV